MDKLNKAQEEEELDQEEQGNGEGEEGEEDMAKKCGAKKSEDLTQDDLQKSIDQLQKLAGEESTSRKQQLLEKAQSDELNKSERDELFQLLGQAEPAKASLSSEVTKGLGENDTLQKALDVSDFLQEQHNELVKSLTTLADHIEKSDSRQHEFNLVLARAVSSIGQLTKSLGERVGIIEEQPARAPKSRGVSGAAKTLEKSFAGTASSAGVSKAQVLDELEVMIQESMSKSLGGATEDGVDLVTASSKYEQFNLISQGLLDQVQQRIQTKQAAAR